MVQSPQPPSPPPPPPWLLPIRLLPLLDSPSAPLHYSYHPFPFHHYSRPPILLPPPPPSRRPSGPWVPVAVKQLKPHAEDLEKISFLSEAEMMKTFNHPNVIKLFGVVTRGEPLMNIMEFMLYGDLKNYLLCRRNLVDKTAIGGGGGGGPNEGG